MAAILAAACGSEPSTALGDPPPPAPGRAAGASGPVVEAVSVPPARPPLDPGADPRRPLGELRAGYLPVWSPDFDWAFPPEVCGSDWAFDAIAEPTSSADPAVLGDPLAAAALSVMRYEHLVSRALAGPDVLGQLCVAVATVGAARNDALDLLASHLVSGTRSAWPPGHPDEVTVVAASPAAILAAACLTTDDPGAATGEDETAGAVAAPGEGVTTGATATPGEGDTTGDTAAALQAYLLRISRGLEDRVADISYRVSDVTHRPATDCGGFDSWLAEWEQQAADWAAEGEIWATVGRTVTVAELCDAPPPDGPDECPRDWP